ncbi:hypothetical protein [Neorhodopirellula pilleata]|uniref:Glycosyltransferase RgtA/B/C/D-like domain-containing protein n=1 Tax=Neorhodopirellula pilleata TaxID=2714738 RepID=A0A5C6AV79_9BACT|nr:hypothetical protein [Neorhodopirellula pilleata]TWU03873.1 hypothetical protein Pla100_08080 [Neorhodopirellula pilleata]
MDLVTSYHHSILVPLFDALGSGRNTIWQVASVILFGWMAFLSLEKYAPKRHSRWLSSDWHYWLAMIATILIVRSASWTFGESNVDESEWMAGAIKLKDGYALWGNHDAHTSGPLIAQTLYFWDLVFGNLNYGTAKLLTCLIWTATCGFTYLTISRMSGSRIARVSTTPLVWCIAALQSTDFVGYNGEHLPILVLSVSTWIMASIHDRLREHGRVHPGALIALGAALGLLPLTKLQAVPMGVFLGVSGLFLLRSNSGWKTLLLAAASPTLLWFAYLLATDQVKDFSTSYVLENFSHATSRSSLSMLERVIYFPRAWLGLLDGRWFVVASLGSISFGILYRIQNFRDFVFVSDFKIALWAMSYVLVACYCVIQTGSFYKHYYLFLLHPLAIASAAVHTFILNSLADRRGAILAVFYVLMCYASSLLPIYRGNLFLKDFSFIQSQQSNLSEVSREINRIADKGTKLAVWGWMPRIYVETGLPMATKVAHTFNVSTPGPNQAYFVGRYADSLMSHDKVIFVDTTGSFDCDFLPAESHSHRQTPPIKRIIDREFTFVGQWRGCAVYHKDAANTISVSDDAVSLQDSK